MASSADIRAGVRGQRLAAVGRRILARCSMAIGGGLRFDG
jgi:hypothetical protein